MTQKVFFGALDQLHENFSDIGAHQDLHKPNFIMLELLIKNYGLEQNLISRHYTDIENKIFLFHSQKNTW